MEYHLELTLFFVKYTEGRFFFFWWGRIMNYCLSAIFTVNNGAVQIKGKEFIYPVGAK